MFMLIFPVNLIVFIFFSWATYNLMKQVPKVQRFFPAWFCWMMIIPFIGYVFMWLMLPFGIPKSMRNKLPKDPVQQEKIDDLFGLGLGLVIVMLLIGIPMLGWIAWIAAMIMLVLYWLKINEFRK